MAEPAPRADLPERIGRYRVVRLIGEGGMGRVFAARDPQLDREVALKLVAPGDGGGGAQALLAEALAMARLSHPNVVAVHDAGLEGGQAFVAMELVEGETLRQWRAALARPWREVLRAYLEAGRGLAAAHRAGLTHGDFKPDNALISPDGRVRVTDFGLARATSAEAGGGVRLGTPGYLAPEQIAGTRADPRSDQYGFCAALHEALFGALPAVSTAYARAGEPRTVPIGLPPVPTGDRAPSAPGLGAPAGVRAATLWQALKRELGAAGPETMPGRRAAAIRRMLERGLSAAAEERYPSMEALLTALERVAAPSRAWRVSAAAVLVAGAVAVPLIVTRARVCAEEVSGLAEVWNPSARASVEKALEGPAREPARAHVLRALDAQAAAWTAMAKDACEATRVRRQQSAEALDLRMACLHQRLGELGAVSQALVAGVKGDAEAIDLADSLGELSPCADPKTLAALVPPPSAPEALAEIARIRRELAKVQAEEHAGKWADAARHGEGVAAAAVKAGYRPVEAEAWLELGRARQQLGNYTGAERAFLDCVVAAEAGRHLRAKAEGLTGLVSLVSAIRDPQRVREWDRQAMAVIEAMGGDRLLTAKRLVAASDLELVEARFDAAEAHAREAVALLEAELGAENTETQRAVRALAQVLLRRGEPMKAIALTREQMEVRGRIFGPDNPERWAPVTVLAQALHSAGYFEEALAEARAAREELRGKIADTSSLAVQLDTRMVAALNNLGRSREGLELAEELVEREKANAARPRGLMSVLGIRAVAKAMLGRFDEAMADHQEQKVLLAKLGGDLGSDRNTVTQIDGNIGLELIWSGKTEEGLRYVRAALEQRASILPPGHPDLRFHYVNIAEGELLGGHPERALEPARTSLELTGAAAGPDSPTNALAMVLLAEALVGVGRPGEAEPLARRALELWEAHPGLPDHVARAHFVLAKALWTKAPREALEEAEVARQRYAALESFRQARAADVEAWIARQRAGPKPVRGPESR